MKYRLRYVYAIAAVSLAVALRYALVPLIGPGLPYVTLFPVTVSVALLAGLGPAIVTGILGGVAADYLFIPPLFTFSSDFGHLARLFVVTLTSAFVGYVGDRLRTARAKAEEQAMALRESEQHLKRSQEIAHLGSWELDVVNNVLTWSDEVYRIFGFQPQEFGATYEAFLEAVHPDDRAAVDSAYSSSLREERDTYEIEHRVVRTMTGEIRFVHEKCQHFRDETGRIIRSAGMVHDITERKRAEEEIRSLNEDLKLNVAQLEAANRELDAFSYSVSHDLRSPLRSIDGFSQALIEDYSEKLDNQGKDFLQRLRTASQRMARLIDDLLNLSRVTRSDMNRVPVNLSDLASTVAADLRDMQPDRNVEFIIAEGVTAKGDEKLLYLVLENLLSNAWKFTGEKPEARIEFGAFQFGLQGPEFTIRSAGQIGQGTTVCYVRDNGIGFDMSYAGKLGVPFQRLHAADQFPGTGIGLATAQRIVRRHGGNLWIEGEVGKGATVYFTL